MLATARLWVAIVLHLALSLWLLRMVTGWLMPLYVYDPIAAAHRREAGAAPPRRDWPPLHKLLWSFPASGERFTDSAAEADRLNMSVLWNSAGVHMLMALLTYVTVTFVVTPPFGRHATNTMVKLTLPSRVSWVLQECPVLLNVAFTALVELPYFEAEARRSVQGTGSAGGLTAYGSAVATGVGRFHLPLILLVLHYAHRSLVYPAVVSANASRVPVHVTWSATIYCLLNGRLQVLANMTLFGLTPRRSARLGGQLVRSPATTEFSAFHCLAELVGSPRQDSAATAGAAVIPVLLACVLFFAGPALFFVGMRINMRSDYYLTALRRTASSATPTEASKDDSPSRKEGYSIPRGGWFDHVSCANFFGEIVEWTGYTLTVLACTWYAGDGSCGAGFSSFLRQKSWRLHGSATFAAASFLVYVLSNLVPRALAHHAWYVQHFGPAYTCLHRKAVLPGIC